jgi:fructose-1,6-bisphosphatase/inositol monophosphatase family enzyme
MFYQEILKFTHQLCDIATDVSKRYYRLNDQKILQEIAKEDDSPVTIADREIEEKIREAIIKKYPNHGIIGEEFGDHQIDAEYLWIIDPIDGTSSFIVGRPIFGNLIAFAKKLDNSVDSNNIQSLSITNNKNNIIDQNLLLPNYKVLIGAMNQPINNERWIGIEQECDNKLHGSWFNDKRIFARNCQEISQAVLCTSSPVFFRGDDANILERICKQTKYQRLGGAIYGGDCYSYACLAMGFVDIIIEPELKIYDFASHIPLLKNSNATISDWQGKDLKLQHNAKLLACSSKELHQQVLKIINDES